jgi:hypothetical protein
MIGLIARSGALSQRQTDRPGDNRAYVVRDQKFESISLHQRVRCELLSWIMIGADALNARSYDQQAPLADEACGGRAPQPVTFIAIWRPTRVGSDIHPRSMATFSGNARPTGAGSPEFERRFVRQIALRSCALIWELLIR